MGSCPSRSEPEADMHVTDKAKTKYFKTRRYSSEITATQLTNVCLEDNTLYVKSPQNWRKPFVGRVNTTFLGAPSFQSQ